MIEQQYIFGQEICNNQVYIIYHLRRSFQQMFLSATIRYGMAKMIGKVQKVERKEIPMDLIVEKLKIIEKKPSIQKQIDKQQLVEIYLNFFRDRRFLTTNSFQTFLDLQSKYSIVLFTKEQIAAKKALDFSTQKLVQGFFQFCVQLYLHYLSPEKKKQLEKKSQLFKEIVITINQFFYFLSPEYSLSIKFTKCFVHYSKQKYLMEFEILNNYRLLIDLILKIPSHKIKQQDAVQLLYFFTNSNFMFRGYDSYFDIFPLLWNNLKSKFQTYPKIRKSALISSNRLNWYSKSLIDKTEEMLFNSLSNSYKNKSFGLSIQEINNSIVCLLKYQRITKDNYKSQKQRKLLEFVVQENKRQGKLQDFFIYSLKLFLFSRVWFPMFWVSYFQSLDKQKIDKKDIYLIFLINNSLKLFQGQVPQEVIKASSIIKEITQKYPNFQSYEIFKDFQDKQVNSSKSLTCQVQVANAIRMFSKHIVKTQVFVDLFCVDILVENKYIIEVNGAQHFIFDIDNKVKTYNLKTKFKAAYLNKLGYSILDIDVVGSTQSSFHLTKLIFGWIKHSQNNINWTPKISQNCNDIT